MKSLRKFNILKPVLDPAFVWHMSSLSVLVTSVLSVRGTEISKHNHIIKDELERGKHFSQDPVWYHFDKNREVVLIVQGTCKIHRFHNILNFVFRICDG